MTLNAIKFGIPVPCQIVDNETAIEEERRRKVVVAGGNKNPCLGCVARSFALPKFSRVKHSRSLWARHGTAQATSSILRETVKFSPPSLTQSRSDRRVDEP